MRAIDAPRSDWQRRRGPAIGPDERDQLRRRDNIDNRIDGPDLVEGHRVRFDAMHLGFGLSEKLEDGDRMRLHVRAEPRTVELGADVSPRAVAVMSLVGASVLAAVSAMQRRV